MKVSIDHGDGVLQFLVRAGDFFYRVEVHPDEESMHAAMQALDSAKADEMQDARAACLRYEKEVEIEGLGWRTSCELGTLFFNATDMAEEVIAHELAHAAVYWARRAGKNPLAKRTGKRDDEEEFAGIMQQLTSDFYEEHMIAVCGQADDEKQDAA